MPRKKKIRIAVDLLPLRPGGENGGAKTLISTLMREFAAASCPFEFLLIAAPWNEKELLPYQADNIIIRKQAWLYRLSRLDRLQQRYLPVIGMWLERRAQGSRQRTFRRWLLFRLITQHCRWQQRFENQRARVLQRRHGVSLMFCPFTAPTLAEPGLPLASVVHDLQHIDLPHLFSEHERECRNQFLNAVCRKADCLVCVSDFTRQAMSRVFNVDSASLKVIPNCIHERLAVVSPETCAHALQPLGLGTHPYFLYPANYWPHKNHKLLLAAYSIYCQQHEGHALDLVFTGALKEPEAELVWIVQQLGLSHKVHFLGYLPDETLGCVWQGCQALVFPSLYEGFGIPVLEAMRFDKPVACSRIGSLPEVGGEAAQYFDPRKPEEIAQAMRQVGHDPALRERLAAGGRKQLESFKPQAMIDQYLAVFHALTSTRYNKGC